MKHYRRGPSVKAPQWVVWDIETRGKYLTDTCEIVEDWFTPILAVALHSDGRWIHACTTEGCRGYVGATGTVCGELVSKAQHLGWVRRGLPWYAHYSGGFDALVALRDLIPAGWHLEKGIYNSSFGVWFADLTHRGAWLELRDSMRLLPDTGVKALGKRIGLPKIEVDRTRVGSLEHERAVEYCLRDCEIPDASMKRLFSQLPVEGDTLPSRSTRYIRNTAVPRDAWRFDPKVDKEIFGAYYGGRVEVFRRTVVDGLAYDINSSYPWSMTQPLPTRYIGFDTQWSEAWEGIVDVTVTQPECAYPVLPYKPKHGPLKGTLTFPVGTWRGMYTAPELRYAMSQGVVIERVHGFWQYEVDRWMAPFIENAYQQRAALKASGDDFGEYCQKKLLNSTYGKLVEHSNHETWTMNDPGEEFRERIVALTNGKSTSIWSVEREEPGAFRHAAAGAYVTAYSRILLHRALVATDAAYCDTDCVRFAFRNDVPLDVSKTALGAWKRESHFAWGEYVAPKIYLEAGRDGVLSVRCKGFWLPPCDDPRCMDTRDKHSHMHVWRFWQELLAGEDITREVTRSFVQQVRKGRLAPCREKLTRAYSGGTPKRCWNADGTTRPWTITELNSREIARKPLVQPEL